MRNKQKLMLNVLFIVLLVLSSFPLITNISYTSGKTTKDVKTFGLLVDQFAPSTRAENNYGCNANELKKSLINIGWPTDSFSYLFGEGTISKTNLKQELDYLEETVDGNDVVIIFVAAHGHTYLRDVLNFNTWFHQEFLEIPTNYKVLLIDSCYAGEFIEPLQGLTTNNSFYAMGSVSAIEYAIAFTPEDAIGGWPYSEPIFYGIISAHFWSITLTNSSADSNLDSYVSMEEMYDYSLPIIRKIYSEVFIEEPELAEFIENDTGYLDNYPNPEVINTISIDIALAKEYLTNNIEALPGLSQGQLFAIFIPLGAILISTIVIILIVYKRKKAN